MDSLSSAPGKQGHPQNNRVRLIQRGKGTLTSSKMLGEIMETRIHKWGKARNLGEFDSLEAALTASDQALKKNHEATFMVVTPSEVVLAEKRDEKFHEKRYARSEKRIKIIFFMVCTLVLGGSLNASGTANTLWTTAIWMVGLYMVLWSIGLMLNSVESCVAAIVLTINACLFFPTIDLISARYLKSEKREHEAQSSLAEPP